MKTVFVVGGDAAVCRMFQNLGWEVVKNFSITTPDLICFTGGADVQPHLYGEHNVASYVNPARDEREMEVYTYCKGLGVPMVGICRGGQFLNVMEGGKMFQDVNSHTETHHLQLVETGEVFKVTSTHHQMMRPAPHGKVLAVAALATHRVHGTTLSERRHMIEDHDFSVPDTEVVQYGNILCFQPHPEYRGNDDTLALFVKLLEGIVLCAE